MNKKPDKRELENQIGLLKKDFEIMQAKNELALNAIRVDQNALRADIERAFSINTKWIIGGGLGLGALVLGVAAYLS